MPPPHTAYVVIDVETTGLLPGEDHIYEIAMSAFSDAGVELERFESLVRPVMKKLSKRLAPVAAAPTFEDIAGTVCDWLRAAPAVGHNVTFDLAMIDGELGRFGAGLPGVPYIDTLALAAEIDLGSPDLRLSTLIPHLGITGADFHTAMADVWAANQLLGCLRAAQSGTGGLAPLPEPMTFHSLYRGPWPDLPGRSAPLPRDPAVFPAAVRRPDKDEPGLHGTTITITSADFTPSPELQRQVDERTVEVARQAAGSITPEMVEQLPPRIAGLLGPLASSDFAEALAAATEFIDWGRDPTGDLHAAEADWSARGFTGPDGIARLTRIVELFADSRSMDLPEAAITLARLKRTEPSCVADEVEAAYRVAFDCALADDREFNAFSAELHADDGGDEDAEDEEDDDLEFEQAEQVLDEWIAYLRGIGDQQRVDRFLAEFSDPVWGFSD